MQWSTAPPGGGGELDLKSRDDDVDDDVSDDYNDVTDADYDVMCRDGTLHRRQMSLAVPQPPPDLASRLGKY